VVVYAAVLILNAIAWFILLNVLATNPDLLEDPAYAKGFAADRFSSLIGMATGVVGAGIGFFWSPIAATALFFALPIFFAVVSEGFESVGNTPMDSSSP
jgi:hypothetical protein